MLPVLEFITHPISFVVITFGLYWYWCYFGRKRKKYPPGPIPWPILGNALSLGTEVHLGFQRYVKKYGPIFSVKIASEEAVVLHGAQLIKEAFNHPNIAGRPVWEAARLFLSNGNGIGGLEYNLDISATMKLRTFVMRNLHEFGVGKNSMESLILDEATELVTWIKKQNGSPVELHRRFSLATVNTLWRVVTGERYEQDDPKISNILDQFELMIKSIFGGNGKSLLILFYPAIAKYFPNWSGWNYLTKLEAKRRKIFEKAILEHQQTLSEGPPRDLIDAYLQEIEKTTDPTSVFHKSNAGARGIVALITELFIAGSDTTTVTLDWVILYLIHYPDIQTKIQNEIDLVVGKSRPTSVADIRSMPNTEAFLLEVHRISSMVPYGVPHCATEDTELRGYLIPKGVSVYASFYTTHHDPEVWGDPKNFRPDRFLSSDGSKVEKHDSLLPFSIGRRQCPGELLARHQLFLFLTTLLQNFRICNEDGKPLPTLDNVPGNIVLDPYPYSVILRERL